MSLLLLPYDIRHQIYQNLFPPGQQLYIQAINDTLRSITPEHKISTALLLTSRSLSQEASEYLYNNYLFNIIGTKRDCLIAYKKFLSTINKHARDKVYVDAFSNGSHSSTMCLSIQAGEGRMPVLKRRERGEPKEIADLEKEVAMGADSRSVSTGDRMLSHSHALHVTLAVCFAIVAIAIPWLVL